MFEIAHLIHRRHYYRTCSKQWQYTCWSRSASISDEMAASLYKTLLKAINCQLN